MNIQQLQPAILEAARQTAREYGYAQITRAIVGKACGMTLHQIGHCLRTAGVNFADLQAQLKREGFPPGEFGATSARNPVERRAKMVEAGLTLAERVGLMNFSRPDVAREAGLPLSTVQFRFGGLPGLRAAIVAAALDNPVRWAQVLLEAERFKLLEWNVDALRTARHEMARRLSEGGQ